jgi:hypothetical protein
MGERGGPENRSDQASTAALQSLRSGHYKIVRGTCSRAKCFFALQISLGLARFRALAE